MNENSAHERARTFRSQIDTLRHELGKAVVGHQDVIDGVLTCLIAGGHALLEGVPGLGKTLLVRSLAEAVHLTFSRIQFTPDLMPADVLGTTMVSEDERGHKTFAFHKGPLFANIVLADEINRATPKTQSALLEAMQEHAVTIAKQTYLLDQPFFVLATQNPLEMEGTYPLPEAQLDRFLLKLQVAFPARDDLIEILDRTTGLATPTISPILDGEQLLSLRRTLREVAVAPHVRDYAVQLLEATHPQRRGAPPSVERYVRFGSSPRGAQACLLAAKFRALMAGRFHVAVQDLKEVAKPALRHRIILSFEGEAEGIRSDQMLDDVLAAVKESDV